MDQKTQGLCELFAYIALISGGVMFHRLIEAIHYIGEFIYFIARWIDRVSGWAYHNR
jgi:hypothetical protein